MSYNLNLGLKVRKELQYTSSKVTFPIQESLSLRFVGNISNTLRFKIYFFPPRTQSFIYSLIASCLKLIPVLFLSLTEFFSSSAIIESPLLPCGLVGTKRKAGRKLTWWLNHMAKFNSWKHFPWVIRKMPFKIKSLLHLSPVHKPKFVSQQARKSERFNLGWSASVWGTFVHFQ